MSASIYCRPPGFAQTISNVQIIAFSLFAIAIMMKGSINTSVRTVPCVPGRLHAPATSLCSRQHLTGQTLHAARQPAAPSASRGVVSLKVQAEASSGAASPPWKQQNARLVLEDGSVWHGSGFGATGTTIAEVVFNTSMSGYQVRMRSRLSGRHTR